MARGNSGKNIPVHGSDSVPSLRAALQPVEGRWAEGLSLGCLSTHGCPTGCSHKGVALCGAPGSSHPWHYRIHPLCRVPVFGASSLGAGGCEFGGDPVRCLGMPRGGDTGVNPVTCPAAGTGWERSFGGQRRAAALPLPGWRWGCPFLTPLHPVNHVATSRGLCRARANPQSQDVLLILYFMPLAPGKISPVQPALVRRAYPAALPDAPAPAPNPGTAGASILLLPWQRGSWVQASAEGPGAPAAQGQAVRGFTGVCRSQSLDWQGVQSCHAWSSPDRWGGR